VLTREWGGPIIAIRDRPVDASTLPALIPGEREGLATYLVEEGAAELVTLNAFRRSAGIGTALVEALAGLLAADGVRELHVSTTNDNLDALRFYQRRGFRLAAVHVGEVDRERVFKPSIPAIGALGIGIHDAIELVRRLDDGG
jgi:GNAT superfamily N-acetyltransferase